MSAGTIEVKIVAEDVFKVKSETRKISTIVSDYVNCYFLPNTSICKWQRLNCIKKFYKWNSNLDLLCSNPN